jgi:tetratricopeptide (TPR) repeat protein
MRYLLIPTLLLLSALPITAEPTSSLPPLECVELLRQARVYGMEGDPAKELEHLQQVAEKFPEEMAPINELLDYHRRIGLPQELYNSTFARFRSHLEDPGRPPELIELSRLILDVDTPEDRLVEIREHLQARSAESPDDTRTLQLLYELNLRQQRWEDAAANLERLFQLTQDRRHLFPLTRLYQKLEQWQAIADLLEGRAQESEDLRVIYLSALSHLGKAEKSLEQIDRLLSNRAPDRTGWYAAITERTAWRLYDAGSEEAAEALFRRALELEPNAVRLRETLLYLFADPEEQLRHQQKLAEKWQGESHPQDLFDEGTRKLTTGDAEGALPLLRRAVHGLPKLEAAWYNLGMAAYRLEDWETVDSAFARAAELQPEREANFFFRGIALGKLERCEESVAVLEQAAALDPERALTHYYLYFCLNALGRTAEARKALARYEELK